MLKNTQRLWVTALLVGWVFDLLFWRRLAGINYFLFTLLALAGGFFIAWREGQRPHPRSLILLVPWAFCAVMSFIRLEPFTTLLNFALGLLCMAILAITFKGGRWLEYSLADYVKNLLVLAGSTLTEPALLGKRRPPTADTSASARTSRWKASLPVLRGVLLAVPVLLVFTALLASADAIFADQVKQVFALFDLEILPEYLVRLIYIAMLGFILVGVYVHALFKSQDETLLGQDKPVLSPFLGFTEAVVVLGSVAALFAAFVAIQFRYFFGGQANIHLEGFTYAEYARRGFGELVAVAFFSLLLLLALSAATRRESPSQKRSFSSLSVAVVALVIVILVSAFQRLLLYEQAYDFTRFRTYPHVFMVWLGLLLAAVALLELTGKLRYFALAALVAAVGFSATLNLINVDGFIVRQNVARTENGAKLDTAYLNSLSADAVPALVVAYQSDTLSEEVRARVGGVLACRVYELDKAQPEAGWPSFHLARWRAGQLLRQNQAILDRYPVETGQEDRTYSASVLGESQSCLAGYTGE